MKRWRWPRLLCAVEAPVVSKAGRAGSYPRPACHLFWGHRPGVIYGRKERQKPTPFSSCFEGMPAFALPLVLLRLLVNLLAFRNSGFSLLRKVYTFGLDGPSRIHSDHLSRPAAEGHPRFPQNPISGKSRAVDIILIMWRAFKQCYTVR